MWTGKIFQTNNIFLLLPFTTSNNKSQKYIQPIEMRPDDSFIELPMTPDYLKMSTNFFFLSAFFRVFLMKFLP